MLKLTDAQKRLAVELHKTGFRPVDWPPAIPAGVEWVKQGEGYLYTPGCREESLTVAQYTAWCDDYLDAVTALLVGGCAVPPTKYVAEDGSFLTGKWAPRSEPVIARDCAAFWVVDQRGEVVQAVWNIYPRGGKFQSRAGNDEGMCGFAVSFYQPIIKPEAPTC